MIVSADGKSVGAPVAGVPAVNSSRPGRPARRGDRPRLRDRAVGLHQLRRSRQRRLGHAVARGRLVGNTLQDVSVIFRQLPKVSGSGHYGSRFVFRPDKTLFITLGERQTRQPGARPGQPPRQGRAHQPRRQRAGRQPEVRAPLGRPEIWSYGHRNPQGAALHPTTGELWDVRTRPAGRRRDQHRARRRELRLAGEQLRLQLRRPRQRHLPPRRRRARAELRASR